MRRAMAGLGAVTLATAWMMTAPGTGAAQVEDPKETPKAKPRARVETLRLGGGAHLGVSLQDVGKDDAARLKLTEEKGALVKEVHADSPAAKAGLEAGDVILEFQGQPVWSAAQLSRFVRETPPGRTVTLVIQRDGASRSLRATLDERRGGFDRLSDLGFDMSDGPMALLAPEPPDPPRPPRAPRAPRAPQAPRLRDFDMLDGDNSVRVFRDLFRDVQPAKLGIEYEELSDQLAGYFKVEGGVLVSSVEEAGPAAKAGVKAGDVIVKVDGKDVRDSGDLREAVASLDPGQEATLTLSRDGRPLDVKLTVGGKARRAPKGPTT
jgi:serine protease Do